jgi:hypothetical protein
MTPETIEKQWSDASVKDDFVFRALVEAGAIKTEVMTRLNKSDNDLVVGTQLEARELQRGGVIFTRPMSRRQVVDALKSLSR